MNPTDTEPQIAPDGQASTWQQNVCACVSVGVWMGECKANCKDFILQSYIINAAIYRLNHSDTEHSAR